MSEYDVSKSVAAQKEFCEKTGEPHFAPSTGFCYCCGTNIYHPIAWERNLIDRCQVHMPLDAPEVGKITGITVEEAGKSLVTGCPHCHRSYCD